MATVVYAFDAGSWRRLPNSDDMLLLLGRADTTVWIDVDDESPETATLFQGPLALHPLVVEDIFSDRITPKVEEYDEFLYIVMHGVKRHEDSPEKLGTVELDVVLGSNWVLTHHSSEMRTVDALRTEIERNPKGLSRGPAFVAHALIDRLADFYLPVVDKFDDEITEIEHEVIENPHAEPIGRILSLRRSIQQLRRLSLHQRDVLQRISRGDFDRVPEVALPFYRDVYDHFIRIADLADNHRELLTTALETYMSVTANRTNEIMKVLALISTIMLPLTFIAGVYGMNFEFMPELRWKYGYVWALGLMLGVAVLFAWYFQRRGWLALFARRSLPDAAPTSRRD